MDRENAAREICAVLRKDGFRALLAGGCVRDMLLGRTPQDYDVATNARPEEVMKRFPKTIAVGAKFGVVIVVRDEGFFEVATFRADGPYLDGRHPSSVTFTEEEQDAQRRDFTINAMFYDPERDTVLDYVGGQADLEVHILRAVGDPECRFEEDHLRLLRAVRFASRLEYQIEADTFAAMCALAEQVLSTSAERIRDELLKMLTEGHADAAFRLLECTGLLEPILPEVAAMRGVEQPAAFHPEGDVWEHTLLLLAQLPYGVSPTVAVAALLHDVGKPPTQTFEDRIRFNLHEKAGARITEKICRRLRMSNNDTCRIVWLVENHMRLKDFMNMRKHRRIRFAREEGFDELLLLCRMDALASHGDTDFIDEAETYIASLEEESIRPVPLLTGKDLIEMGYTPGPQFKHILQEVETLQLEGQLKDSDAARQYVTEKFSDMKVG